MPLHPATVHFPITLLFVVLGICLWRLAKNLAPEISQLSFYLLILSELALLLAILTGRSSGQSLVPSSGLKEVLDLHEILGYATIWANGLLLIWMYLRHQRWSRKELTGFVVALSLVCGLMVFSAHLGGKMVFEFGAGMIQSAP